MSDLLPRGTTSVRASQLWHLYDLPHLAVEATPSLEDANNDWAWFPSHQEAILPSMRLPRSFVFALGCAVWLRLSHAALQYKFLPSLHPYSLSKVSGPHHRRLSLPTSAHLLTNVFLLIPSSCFSEAPKSSSAPPSQYVPPTAQRSITSRFYIISCNGCEALCAEFFHGHTILMWLTLLLNTWVVPVYTVL